MVLQLLGMNADNRTLQAMNILYRYTGSEDKASEAKTATVNLGKRSADRGIENFSNVVHCKQYTTGTLAVRALDLETPNISWQASRLRDGLLVM